MSSTYNAVLSMGAILSRRIDSSEGNIHSTGSATYLAARSARVRGSATDPTGAPVAARRALMASPLRKWRWTARRLADGGDGSGIG